jgi:anti-sigma-K factor RskA
VRTGEAFAVSLEPAGGSTTGEISGPIVQSGAIYHVR